MSKALPPLTISDVDHEMIASLVANAETLDPAVADYLDRELNRAKLVAANKLSSDFIAMGRKITYRDEANGRERQITLVYPGEQDANNGKVSVLTPIGAALIGMRAGQSISWTNHTGLTRNLTVLTVGE